MVNCLDLSLESTAIACWMPCATIQSIWSRGKTNCDFNSFTSIVAIFWLSVFPLLYARGRYDTSYAFLKSRDH